MANIVRYDYIDETDQTKSVAVVNVQEVEIPVLFWYSLYSQWGQDGTEAYIKAEALASVNLVNEAVVIIEPFASGVDERQYRNEGGELFYVGGEDKRNWAQRWIDEHPVPQVVEPEVSEASAEPLT